MRVLAMTNLYPNPYQPHRATFTRHQFRLLNELHPVQVIAPILWIDERKARRGGAPALAPGRRVTHDGLAVDHPRYWYTPRVLRSWYGRFFQWSVRSTFRAAVTEFKPDLVFAPWAYPDGWAAVKLAHAAGLPAVVQVHGSDVRLVGDFKGREGGTAAALREADGVVAVSQDLADRVVRLGADPSRVRVIIDGVDRAVFCSRDRTEPRTRLGFRAGTKHLLYVGNLQPVKGVDVLLDACARLSEGVGPWELHLVGAGEMRSRLSAQVAASGLTGRVRFHGSQPHSDLPDWFRAADLFVLASRSEGVPNVLLESAACGTPFVATAVGGVPEVAALGASRLVPPEDPQALAAAITEILKSPPPPPALGPRDRREAVADLAQLLAETHARFRAEVGRPGGPTGLR